MSTAANNFIFINYIIINYNVFVGNDSASCKPFRSLKSKMTFRFPSGTLLSEKVSALEGLGNNEKQVLIKKGVLLKRGSHKRDQYIQRYRPDQHYVTFTHMTFRF
jgi:hypothetical protein